MTQSIYSNAPGTCTHNKYSRSYQLFYHLDGETVRSECGIRYTDDDQDLENQYFQCSKKLMEKGRYQPAQTILFSLGSARTDWIRDLAFETYRSNLQKMVQEDAKTFFSIGVPLLPFKDTLGLGVCEYNNRSIDSEFYYGRYGLITYFGEEACLPLQDPELICLRASIDEVDECFDLSSRDHLCQSTPDCEEGDWLENWLKGGQCYLSSEGHLICLDSPVCENLERNSIKFDTP